MDHIFHGGGGRERYGRNHDKVLVGIFLSVLAPDDFFLENLGRPVNH